jgi:hypothetical protein
MRCAYCTLRIADFTGLFCGRKAAACSSSPWNRRGQTPSIAIVFYLKTNFPVKTPPFREEPGWGGVFAAPSQPLSER